VGAFSGHNGKVHMDFDNFELCAEGNPDDLEERIQALEEKVEDLENRVSLLEILTDKIMNYFSFMPNFFKKKVLCGTLKESGENEIEEWGLKCEMKQLKNKDRCVCRRS
jgi:hypothetical protein